MINILIIGKKSFIGQNIKKYLSNYFKVDSFSYEYVLAKKFFFFNKYTHIINTCIHKKYIDKKYNHKFDLDRKFISKFENVKFMYIFLNTRKIYFQKENITEKSKILPIDNYASNKLNTENFLKQKLNKKLISLRISNIIGKRNIKSKRNHHKLFFDNFLFYRSKKKKIQVSDNFKDFITINQFCIIIKKIINSKITGIYNISLSKKVYISEIIRWLDRGFLDNIKFIKADKNSFTLSNKKIKKEIKVNLTKRQLMMFCKKLI